MSIRLIVCIEEDGGCKDSLECLDEAAIMESVFGQAEEVEEVSGGIEPNLTGFLPEGERGNPDRDEAILAKEEGRPNCG